MKRFEAPELSVIRFEMQERIAWEEGIDDTTTNIGPGTNISQGVDDWL